jgi:hypothetical protein
MNAAAREALWQRLRAAGVVAGELPAQGAPPVPWYVRAMVGTAAWIAAIFLIGAILALIAGVFRSGGAMLAIGASLCAIAIAVMRAGAHNLFVAQFAFAVSLAGQGMFIAGVFSGASFGFGGRDVDALRFLVVAAAETGLVLLAPAYVHRTLCALSAAAAFGAALVVWRIGELYPPIVALAFALLALHATRDGERVALWSPVVAGLALALLAGIAGLIFASSLDGLGARLIRTGLPPWLGHAATTLVFAAVVALLLRGARVSGGSGAGIAIWLAAGTVAAAAWFVSGLLAAGILLLVAFAVGHEVLIGLGVIALLGTLSRYYYGLEATLLIKSAALAATGVALFAARYGMRFLPPAPGEAGDA